MHPILVDICQYLTLFACQHSFLLLFATFCFVDFVGRRLLSQSLFALTQYDKWLVRTTLIAVTLN